MEVVKGNFEQAAELFEAVLKRSEFVAFDLELTGVKGRPETWADSAEIRYGKMRRVALNYSIIQVGVCLFVERGGQYDAHPFTFYVYPEETYGQRNITLETSGIAFNKLHHMDFNKWIYEGIPYVTEAVDGELRARLLGTSAGSDDISDIASEADRDAVMAFFCQLEEWLSSQEPTLEVAGLSAALRKHIAACVRAQYPDLQVAASAERNRATLLVHRRFTQDEQRTQTEKYRSLIGFRRIFQLLKSAQLPIIGHNMLADLLFLFNSMQVRLPETLAVFKHMVNTAFPVVYDTRHLLNSLEDLQNEFNAQTQYRGLKEIYTFLQMKVGGRMFTLPQGFEKYRDEHYAHEAGFDALMTGMCFAYMQRLEGDASSQANLIPLFKCYYCVNLAGDDLREAVTSSQGEYIVVTLGDSPSAAAFLYSLSAENLVEVKPVDDSAMIVKTESLQTLTSVVRTLDAKGLAWVHLDEYLVNRTGD